MIGHVFSFVDVAELEQLVRRLQLENAALRGVITRWLCGDTRDGRSCQRPRDHAGEHAWLSPDGAVTARW